MLDLSYSMWGRVLLTRDGTLAPALGVQSLSHWTTREVPTFNVLRNCQTVLHNGCAIFLLHSQQQGMMIPIFPYVYNTCYFCFFFFLSIAS